MPGAEVEDLLSCPVCYQQFDNASRKPYDLGCGHCVCEECLRSAPGSFRTCPECRSPSRNPHVSIALLRLVDQLGPQSQPSGAGRQPPPPHTNSSSSARQRGSSSSTQPWWQWQVPRPPPPPVAQPTSQPQQPPQAGNHRQPPARPPRSKLAHYAASLPVASEILQASNYLWSLLLPLLAALYTISPIDLVPDVIPVLGWLDDAIVIAMVLYTLCAASKRRR